MRIVRLRITGRVQGVGYRDWARRRAQALALDGWVRNCSDGAVELLAAGDDAAISRLIDDCRQGPASAHVVAVDIGEEAEAPPSGFVRRPTA